MSDQINPVGTTGADHIAECREDPDFRAEYERLRPYDELARIVLRRRAALGQSQADLAARMGVSVATVSRVEGGQHATNLPTLKKLADAFGIRAVIGFESGGDEKPEPELVPL
jgi:ribosome-binding protein aMBF1 (putative translation factor)